MLLVISSAALAVSFPAVAAQPADQILLQGDNERLTDTNQPGRVKAGPDDGRIAFWTAYLLQNHHYANEIFDDGIASQFLDQYLDTLDPFHLHFLQSDIAGFEKYRTTLDNLTLTRRGVADTSPAYEIMARFVERSRQRVDFATELLQKEKFTFDTNERVKVDRRKEPYPENLEAARELWRQRLRLEYLQEKLALEGKKPTASRTNAPSAAPEKSVHEQIVEKLTHRYNRNLKMFTDWNHEDVLGAYLTALAHVYDPHSDYFNRPELESFRISMNLQLFGIGAELRSEDGYCRVERLLPGGPAIKSKKINAGDHIVAVAQGPETPVDVIDMDLRKVVQLIRGPKGTEVRLTLQPGGDKSAEQTVVTLVRDEIPLDDQAAKGKVIDLPVGGEKTMRLGVINLPSFYAPTEPGAPVAASEGGGGDPRHNTSTDVAKLLAKFKQEGVKGVILDLRMNGGGVLEEAIKVAGLFIPQGPIVQARDLPVGDADVRVQVYPDRDPTVAYDGPLIVLTSRFSASASEIVAGALQDYGRAIIVGDASTHGKGTVQTVTSLRPLLRIPETDTNEPGALKFTIRKFYRASGASTQLKGVLPDIVLPSRWNHSTDIGESSLDNPLEWDTIPGARYEKLSLVEKYLSELLKRSAERVATNRDFVYLREEIEEFRKLQADKTLSLNEAERKKEREQAEARAKARQEELRARKEPDVKMYEITLKLAELPGLPAPMEKTNSVADASAALGLPVTAGEDSDEPAVPEVDIHLEEAQRILVDYINLLPKDEPLVLAN